MHFVFMFLSGPILLLLAVAGYFIHGGLKRRRDRIEHPHIRSSDINRERITPRFNNLPKGKP